MNIVLVFLYEFSLQGFSYKVLMRQYWRGPRLGLPLTAKRFSLNTRWPNTIDNVKAKIEGVKAKIQDEEDWGSWQDPHLQDVQSPARWLHLRPVPYKRDPHDKSLPCTTSLRLAREVSALHDKSGSDWCVGQDARHKPKAQEPPLTLGERFPTPCKYNNWRPCKQLTLPRDSMLAWPAARPSQRHHLPLCHTQAQLKALKHPLRRARA
jgi:hypothetical protein